MIRSPAALGNAAQSARLKAEEQGWGFAAAVGHEWRLSALVALSPRLDLGYLNVGKVSAFTQVLGEGVTSACLERATGLEPATVSLGS